MHFHSIYFLVLCIAGISLAHLISTVLMCFDILKKVPVCYPNSLITTMKMSQVLYLRHNQFSSHILNFLMLCSSFAQTLCPPNYNQVELGPLNFMYPLPPTLDFFPLILVQIEIFASNHCFI